MTGTAGEEEEEELERLDNKQRARTPNNCRSQQEGPCTGSSCRSQLVSCTYIHVLIVYDMHATPS